MNSKECPKCKNCSPDDAASCRTCGAEFPSLRAITPDDVTREGDRNYDLGRKHAKEELHPAIAALEQLYTSCGHLRLRCEMQAPKIKAFSDWEENSKAMRTAENVLRPSNRPSSEMTAPLPTSELPSASRGSHSLQRVVRGHLSATLYLGDCREIAPTLQGVDAIISDPPYGMDWDTDSTRFTGGEHARGDGRSDWGDIAHDAEPFDPALWLEYPRCVLFGANHYAQRLPVGTTLVWIKKDQHLWGTFLSDAEIGWMKGGHGVYAYRKPWNPPAKDIDLGGDGSKPRAIHPAQKPVALMAWCMERAKVPQGATVLDPYMGSGTTGIACLRTGRNFVGIEKDPKHFATALERLEREANQGALL